MSWNRTIDDALDDADYLLDAIEEVRDPELDASEYTFLDDIEKIHSAPSKKGNGGLANFLANLAVYEQDGGLDVDNDLVELADERLSDEHDGKYRKRFRNIVKDSESRPKKSDSMHDNGVNGHQRLIQQIGSLYEAFGRGDEAREKIDNIFKDERLSLNNDNWNLSYSRRSQNHEQQKGGETIMTEEYEKAEALLSDVEDGVFDNYDRVVDVAQRLDLGEESEIYVLGESMKVMASADSIDAERRSNLLLTYKRRTDDLVDELDGQFNQLRSHYIDEVGDHAVAHRNNGERAARISDNMDEGIDNLAGLNRKMNETLDESGVAELTELKDSLGPDYEEDSEE